MSHQALGRFGLVQQWPVVRLVSRGFRYAAAESTNWQLKEHFKELEAFVCCFGLVSTPALWHPIPS